MYKSGSVRIWHQRIYGLQLARSGIFSAIFLAALGFSPTVNAQTTPIVGPVPIDRFTLSPGGVDLRSGNFTYSNTDLSIGEGTAGIALVRTGDNGKLHTERFGQFSHNWEIYIVESTVTSFGLTISGTTPTQLSVSADGRSNTFRSSLSRNSYGSMGAPINPSNAKLDRVQSGSSYFYRYTAPDGTLITFSTMLSAKCTHLNGRCAYASEMLLPNGALYTLTYDELGTANARLRRVSSNAGYALLLEYGAAGALPLISRACVLNLAQIEVPSSGACPDGVSTASYQYSGSFMSRYTDPAGADWLFGNTYTDGASPYTLSFYKPGISAPYLVNTYAQDPTDAYFRVVSRQVFNPGHSYDYNFRVITVGDFPRGSLEVAGGTYWYDGKSVSAVYGARKPPKLYNDDTHYVTAKPERITDELGRVHLGNYCVPYPNNNGGCRPTALQDLTDPEGIQTFYTYDSTLNVTRMVTKARIGSGLPDTIQSATYDCSNLKSCAKPTSVTDPRNAITTYAYAPEHGGIIRETGPLVNGVTAEKRYIYEQRYAWVRSGGGYVSASTPIWLLTQTSSCRTGNPGTSGVGCAVAGDEVITTYDYGPDAGPNTLLLRGQVVTADGVSLRTCYGYDALGNRVSETEPKAGLTSCS